MLLHECRHTVEDYRKGGVKNENSFIDFSPVPATNAQWKGIINFKSLPATCKIHIDVNTQKVNYTHVYIA